jgi:hypothetical protein
VEASNTPTIRRLTLFTPSPTFAHSSAEQNLNQSKAAFEGLLTFTRNAIRSIDQQSSAICEHSIAVAEQTISNAFDLVTKWFVSENRRNSLKSRASSLIGKLRCSAIKPRST